MDLFTIRICKNYIFYFFPDFGKPPHPLPSLTHASTVPEKSSALNPSQYLKHWLLSTKAGMDRTTRIMDRTTAGTITGGIRAGRLRNNPGTAGPDKRAQMLKMITALEELHRTFNSTLSSRITIMPRGNHTVMNMLSLLTDAFWNSIKEFMALSADEGEELEDEFR